MFVEWKIVFPLGIEIFRARERKNLPLLAVIAYKAYFPLIFLKATNVSNCQTTSTHKSLEIVLLIMCSCVNWLVCSCVKKQHQMLGLLARSQLSILFGEHRLKVVTKVSAQNNNLYSWACKEYHQNMIVLSKYDSVVFIFQVKATALCTK